MLKIPIQERPHWQQQAESYGFKFHTMYGERYWDERAYYQFTLHQIENDLEDPSEELNQMALHIVDKVVRDEALMTKFAIPEEHWDVVRNSWLKSDPSLYGRMDFSYDGKGPAKLLEMNHDTPTSIWEAGFWQWLWLEDNVDCGKLNRASDQFNIIQEKLVSRFAELADRDERDRTLFFSCCKDTEEDRGTVQYLEDCAIEAGINTRFVFIEDIGISNDKRFSDLQNNAIEWAFKLYPWEFMLREEFGQFLHHQNTSWLEPPWKSIISNKAILPLLWQYFPNHPNLLPAFFEDEKHKLKPSLGIVKKPLFSREGANIEIAVGGQTVAKSGGDYGEEGHIYQSFNALPKFGGNHTLVGSWIIGDTAAGLTIREDTSPITQDSSRFVPHIILN